MLLMYSACVYVYVREIYKIENVFKLKKKKGNVLSLRFYLLISIIYIPKKKTSNLITFTY